MKAIYLLPLMAFLLVACDDARKHNPPIKPETAKTIPPDAKFNNLKIETLSNDVRSLLGAKDEKDIIIVVKAKGGSIAYGAPGMVFKKAEKGELTRYLEEAKKTGKNVEIVNTITINTLRASPECELYDDGLGNNFWYNDSCPH